MCGDILLTIYSRAIWQRTLERFGGVYRWRRWRRRWCGPFIIPCGRQGEGMLFKWRPILVHLYGIDDLIDHEHSARVREDISDHVHRCKASCKSIRYWWHSLLSLTDQPQALKDQNHRPQPFNKHNKRPRHTVEHQPRSQPTQHQPLKRYQSCASTSPTRTPAATRSSCSPASAPRPPSHGVAAAQARSVHR